eukprot:scaffold47833_cov57-Attheya_sp.AAC.1
MMRSSWAWTAVPNRLRPAASHTLTDPLHPPVTINSELAEAMADKGRPSPYCDPSKAMLRMDLYNV